MSKKKVGVVCGGYSSEYKISLQSGKTVFSQLDRNKWEVFLIILAQDSWTAKDDDEKSYIVSKGDFSLQSSETSIKLDLIFNLVHGSIGENGQLAALWELLDIPFSSCNSYIAALTLNKRDCLTILRELNIPTAKYYTLDKGNSIDTLAIIDRVGLPCFVKANRAGSSFGVFKVYDKKNLIPSIEKAFKEDSQLIIESALEGREVSVGVAKFDDEIRVLPITEIISENDFFDFAAKYEGESQEITPAQIPKNWQKDLKDFSKKIYLKLGLRGFIRSEFIFVNNTPHILEVNSVPGMTSKSIIPKQVEAMNLEIPEFLTKILMQVDKEKNN
ncbi:MAG: D-alanine--D-alanine ligase [Flavobacteriaceae bacterium]|nr:D-alanine--D-alanine ligase [Flavobacteriaceae bacterium]